MTATVYKLSNEPVKGIGFTFPVVLYSQADTKLIKTDPTLAAGDIVIYKDNVLDGNIDTLPADIGSSGIIPVALSIAEMTADQVVVWFHDAAGAEWCDLTVTFSTVQAVSVGTSDLAAGAQMDLVDDAVDAGSIKADAVTKIQAGLSTLTASQVWAYATKTLSSFGTLAEDIWAYVRRTLTASAAEAAESTNPGTLALKRGDTWSQAITELGSLVGYTYIDFTVKRSEDDLDADAIVRIRKAASGLKDGLLILNGATGTAASGSITIDDATLGNITIALAATATDDLKLEKGLYYDIQKIVGTVVTTMGSGVLNVTADITRAVT